MKQLANKQILLGITGSIAAYKACELVRLLRDSGSDVRVVMTQAATEFVSPLTFQALSQNPVHRTLLDETAEAAMGHIELARWADAVVIAPASADSIARLAQGRADDLLGAVCLATPAPVAIAPAMNQQMWLDTATQENIALLQKRGLHILGPATGDQACGDVGPGRMLEPQIIREQIAGLFETGALAGLTVVITAGPTHEPIDPVRFISNYSSGRMGYALAEAVVEAGARCILISGPTHLPIPYKVQRVDVQTAQQMHTAVMEEMSNCNIFIAAAAVADYRPAETSTQKIKKDQQQLRLELVRNPDILQDVTGSHPEVFAVGFAAESGSVEHYATQKLSQKKLRIIIANDISRTDIGFDSPDNEVVVYWQGGSKQLPKASKPQIARQLAAMIADHYNESQ
ncbi:MAG: bifunctional phosphopantothenoylcysteine decarboxylase/phosphopantothenate--cysteine ligase CoaBC [Gammaproteobacteria bacterium]|nr:bifunctional phosphopantothenoylcysteine decarboxylase/phosphopantothenate--cysteine ligase CoaBC [Gammaproteobacteria bacterium]